MKKNVVLVGGGVGSSTFTRALRDFPIRLTTIVSAFDDGGSTGLIRRDYGGIALADFRQCLLASMDMGEGIVRALNHRFGSGAFYGVNIANLFLRAFLDQNRSEREGVAELHRLFKINNRVEPVSYDFARLGAELSNGRRLENQQQIAGHLSFDEAPIRDLFLRPWARVNPDAARAIVRADYLVFVPGHFFTSILPHLYVRGFRSAWRKSQAKKIWFYNLLAHRGQDSFYSLRDYLKWFEKKLGRRPFDAIIANRAVAKGVLALVKDRFEQTTITAEDRLHAEREGMELMIADLVSSQIRAQQPHDTVLRAPLRHDREKIRRLFRELLRGRT